MDQQQFVNKVRTICAKKRAQVKKACVDGKK